MTPDERTLEIDREQQVEHRDRLARTEPGPIHIPEHITVIHVLTPDGEQQLRVLDVGTPLDEGRELADDVAEEHPEVTAVAVQYRRVRETEQ